MSSAPASSAAPAASRVFHWMRVSVGFALVVSAARMVAGATFPSPSAALGLAGGKTPAGLTGQPALTPPPS